MYTRIANMTVLLPLNRVKKNEVRFLKGVLPNSNAKTVPKTSCKTVDGQCKCSLENFLSLCDPPSPGKLQFKCEYLFIQYFNFGSFIDML